MGEKKYYFEEYEGWKSFSFEHLVHSKDDFPWLIPGCKGKRSSYERIV